MHWDIDNIRKESNFIFIILPALNMYHCTTVGIMRKSLLLKYGVGGGLVFIKSYQAPFILLHRVEFLHWWEKSGHKYQF